MSGEDVYRNAQEAQKEFFSNVFLPQEFTDFIATFRGGAVTVTPDLANLNSCQRIKFMSGIIQKLGENNLASGQIGSYTTVKLKYLVGNERHEVNHQPFALEETYRKNGTDVTRPLFYQPGDIKYWGLNTYTKDREEYDAISRKIVPENLVAKIRESKTTGKPISRAIDGITTSEAGKYNIPVREFPVPVYIDFSRAVLSCRS